MLTHRQQEILDFICSFQQQQGAVPSTSQIQKYFGFRSPASVTEHLDALEKKGAIRRNPGETRNIRTALSFSSIAIPMLGVIPAGFAEFSEQATESTITFDRSLLPGVGKNACLFALKVRGTSMIQAGIIEGDIVILERGVEAKNGDIVAALIDGEVTLKRYRVQNGNSFLQSENPDYPALIPVGELIIQGIYRALIRISEGRS